MIQLRDYQQRSIDMIRQAVKDGYRSICLVIPTGGGKTRTTAAICETSSLKGNHSFFLAPRRNLVNQTEVSFNDLGLDCGVIMAGEEYDSRHKVDVGSIDTVLARLNRFDNSAAKMATNTAKTMIFDEAHTYASTKRSEYVNDIRAGKYGKGKILILLTATPCTTGGGGLADICEVLLQPVSMLELIKEKHLLQPRYYSAEKPDLSNVSVQKGDYNNKELGEAYSDNKIMGCVVENWKRIAPGTSTVVFCSSRANAGDLVEKFNGEGIPAAYVDALTPDEERHEIFKKVGLGEILIICNVMIIGMGTDIPRLQTVCFATATKSIARWMQGVGRVLRPFKDQKFAYIIDHGGMSLDPKMGPVEFIEDWSLDPKTKVQDRILERKLEKKEPKEIECQKCHMLYKSLPKCPGCGHAFSGKTTEVLYHKADLKEVNSKLTAAQRRNRDTKREDKTRIYAELLFYAGEKGKKEGMAAYMYRDMFGVWPNAIDKTVTNVISLETKQWIKHRNIKQAKTHANGKKRLSELKAMLASGK